MKPLTLTPFLLPALMVQAATPADQICHLGTSQDALRGLEVVQGELLLPGTQPYASLSLKPGEDGLAQVFLLPPPDLVGGPWQRREALRKLGEALANTREELLESGLGSALQRYALTHQGRGPDSLTEPAFLQALAQEDSPQAGLPPYKADSPEARQVERFQKALEGFALVPHVPLCGDLAPKGQLTAGPSPLLIEISPLADDGRHWVLDSALGGRKRVAVDGALLKKQGLSLSKQRLLPIPAEPDLGKPLPWTVLALRRKRAPSAQLILRTEGQVRPLTWSFDPTPKPGPEDSERISRWAYARAMTWRQGQGSPSPLLVHWVNALPRLYGQDKEMRWPKAEWFLGEPPEDREGPSLLSLLGGRAAVDETLQTDRSAEAPESSGASRIPLKEIQGIPVPSHPFEAMLAGRKVAGLPLANCVPLDRSFIYLPRPKETLEELAQGGASFLQKVSGLLREGVLDHDVIARAKEDLGLGSPLGRKLMEMGAVREAAVFTSDLALLSGTEWTVVAELHPALHSVGVLMLGQESVKAIPTARGQAHWALRGNRIFLSTSRAELDLALALEAAQGQGSLGQSSEFRYMRLKLAPTPDTQAFVYLSDPFIRRLVGPEARILQMRQGTERRRLEELSAALELRELDHPGEAKDPEALKRLGYLRPDFTMEGLTIGRNGKPCSEVWGSLDQLRPLARVALESVSPEEAKGYETFRETYTSYWRRYFDPIALRLERGAEGTRSLETFILPLLDSSIYNEWRNLVDSGEPAKPMAMPTWTQPMVAQLSLRLPNPDGVQLREDRSLSRLEPYLGELLSQLGSSAHLAFPDAAPVLQLGGGSPLALFNTPSPLGRDRWLMLAPLLLGPVTRPMVLAMEIKDPAKAKTALTNLVLPPSPLPGGDWFRMQLSREDDGRIILTSSLLGVLTQRHSIQVEGHWLVIANDTTMAHPLVQGTRREAPSHVALGLNPAALKLGRPAAYQAFLEAEASRSWSAQRWLAPWLSGGATVEEAQAASHRVFGSAPTLAPGALGEGSGVTRPLKRYGTPLRPLMPAASDGDFGLLEGIQKAQVEMLFEEDGLRTRVHWK